MAIDLFENKTSFQSGLRRWAVAIHSSDRKSTVFQTEAHDQFGIQSSDPVTHSNALEFLDNTLNPQLRQRLVPLIDSEVTLQERVRLADRFLGFSAN